jgi:hypothetical protein
MIALRSAWLPLADREGPVTRVVAFTIALLAIAATTSAQDNEHGATVTRIGYCQTYGSEGQQLVCIEEMDVTSRVITPSGNLSYQNHVRLHYTIIEPGLTFTNTFRGNSHALFMDGVLQELGSHVNSQYTTDFGDDFVVECSYVAHYHFASDEVQFDRFETDCF